MLYSFQKNEAKSITIAEKELLHSLNHTYNLYHLFLLLIDEVTFYASKKIDSAKNKHLPTDLEINPNMRFVENSFAAQLSQNIALKEHVKESKITWVNYPTVIKAIYELIMASDFYADYMNAKEVTYEDDKELWRKVFKRCIPQCEDLEQSLEEESIFWNDDVEIVLSFVLKTIKRFDEKEKANMPLMPMFKDEEDKEFGLKLMKLSLQHAEEYKALVEANTKNWEIDRIAFMDVLIMQVALTEILNFPSIPVNVSFNEYIEIAKNYSTDRSSIFINGVLDNIVTQLKKENKLIKAKTI